MIRRIILKNLPNFLLNVNFHNSLFSVQKEYIDNSDLVNYIITSKKKIKVLITMILKK